LTIVYQDRLGTNETKSETERGVSLAEGWRRSLRGHTRDAAAALRDRGDAGTQHANICPFLNCLNEGSRFVFETGSFTNAGRLGPNVKEET
jgi:hypothetical protein